MKRLVAVIALLLPGCMWSSQAVLPAHGPWTRDFRIYEAGAREKAMAVAIGHESNAWGFASAAGSLVEARDTALRECEEVRSQSDATGPCLVFKLGDEVSLGHLPPPRVDDAECFAREEVSVFVAWLSYAVLMNSPNSSLHDDWNVVYRVRIAPDGLLESGAVVDAGNRGRALAAQQYLEWTFPVLPILGPLACLADRDIELHVAGKW